jgi:hypothetical protein
MKLHENQPNTRMRGQGGEQLMKQWIWLWAALLVWGLSSGHVMAAPAPAPAPEQGKVVAVVYDNSTSMNKEPRWVPANYALKVLAASLQVGDKLFVVWMSNARHAVPYEGDAGIKRALTDLGGQKDAPGLTPYESISTAINELEKKDHIGKKLWLVVISDGGFNELKDPNFDARATADAKRASAAKINSVFIPIATDEFNETVANIWHDNLFAQVENPTDGQDVAEKIAKVAKKLNGQSDQSMSVKAAGREVGIEAVFPLRGVTIVRQDSEAAVLEDVRWGLQSLPVPLLRSYDFSPNKSLKGMPSMGRVVHVRQANNEVLPVGQKMSLRFGQDVNRLKLIYLPDVAAKFSMIVMDAGEQKPVEKETDGKYLGKYLICGSNYRLKVMLSDLDSKKDLLTNRSDAKIFEVSGSVGGKPLTFSRGNFVQQFNTEPLDPKGVVVSTSLKYPGYFHYESERIAVVFDSDACLKKVTLKVTSGVDDGGVWRSPVDQAGQKKPVFLEVLVDGKPATVDQLAAWLKNLDAGAAAHVLEVTPEVTPKAAGYLLRPRNDCCVWWWRNPGPGEYPSTLILKTDNPRVVINGSPSVKFVLEPPRSLLDKVLWYGCPFALLALILAIVWYVIRLLRKARFGVDSRLETEDRPKEDYGGVIRPSTVVLREECGALKRWLWPSKAEVAVVRGLRFIAEAQGEMRVDGRDLGPKHRVPGWVFDRSRVDAPSVRERRQEDASMSDNVVLQIDEGASEVWMRYRA